MGAWRKEFNHSKSYESLDELSMMIEDWFASVDASITSSKMAESDILPKMSLLFSASWFKDYKNYNKSYRNILATLDNQKYAEDLKSLELMHIHTQLNKSLRDYISSQHLLMETYETAKNIKSKNDENYEQVSNDLSNYTDLCASSYDEIMALKNSLHDTIHKLKCSS